MKTDQTNAVYRRPKRFAGNLHRVIFWVLIGILMACVFALIFGFAVKWIWSVTLVPIFAIPEITYWQAVGIVILARLVFGGFGHRSNRRDNSYHENKAGFSDHQPFFDRMHDRFHGRPLQPNEDTTFQVPEADQKHYQDFWEAKGKQAFAEYIAGRNQDQTD